MQEFTYLFEKVEVNTSLPSSGTPIVDGVFWGEPCVLFTPAYWYSQYIMRNGPCRSPVRHRLGETLADEVTACLLGGHGIQAEVANAAFERLKEFGVIAELNTDVTALERMLREPLLVQSRTVRYRFWKKKAQYLAGAFAYLQHAKLPVDDAIQLRDSLMAIPGIGPKTASWAVRNWTSSNEVAILDIHIVRAGRLMNLYNENDCVERHYRQMELKFVALAEGIDIPTSSLDSLIWSMMRATPRLITRLIKNLRPMVRGPRSMPIRTQ